MCAGCLGVAVCPIPLRLRSNCLKVIAIQPPTVFLSRCHHDSAVVLTYGISDGTGDSSRATCIEPNLPSRRGWSPHAWIRSFRHSLEYWQPLALVLLNTGGKRTEIYRGCNCSKCNSLTQGSEQLQRSVWVRRSGPSLESRRHYLAYCARKMRHQCYSTVLEHAPTEAVIPGRFLFESDVNSSLRK